MNRALWPATLGYAMETMLHPLFRRDPGRCHALVLHALRRRPRVPAVPAHRRSALRRAARERALAVDVVGEAIMPHRRRARGSRRVSAPSAGPADLLAAMRGDWATLARAVSFVGKQGDAHQLLLDVIGLHPASVEFHQRYAESLHHLFNRAKYHGVGAQILNRSRCWGCWSRRWSCCAGSATGRRRAGRLATVLLHARAIVSMVRSIDDRPLSESDPIRAVQRADDRNYLEWLADQRAAVVRGSAPGTRLQGRSRAGRAALRDAASCAAAGVLGREPAAASGRRCDEPAAGEPGAARAGVDSRQQGRKRTPRAGSCRSTAGTRASSGGAANGRRADRNAACECTRNARTRRSDRGTRSAEGRADGAPRTLPRGARRHGQLPSRRVVARARPLPARRNALSTNGWRTRRRGGMRGDRASRLAAASISAPMAGWRICSARPRSRNRCS